MGGISNEVTYGMEFIAIARGTSKSFVYRGWVDQPGASGRVSGLLKGNVKVDLPRFPSTGVQQWYRADLDKYPPSKHTRAYGGFGIGIRSLAS